VVINILKDFQGAVQSDGYGAYNIYENRKSILLLGCWAHARWKVEQALKNDPIRAQFALEQLQLLYRLERQAVDGQYTKEETETLRKEEAYPRLARYVVDGRYQIDNNDAENAVSPLALGRKNYFFCGNHAAAGRAAIIYSLLEPVKSTMSILSNSSPMS
jgi:hypothetical protein